MEKIMIVEDDQLIRELFSRILIERGYQVIECNDYLEALDKYEKLSEKPDIFLVDNLLPHGTGLCFSEKILLRDPNSKILMISGDPNVDLDVLRKHGIRFKTKPITKKELITEVDLLRKMDSIGVSSEIDFYITQKRTDNDSKKLNPKKDELQFITLL